MREGAILSPILFAVFIDDLVADLRAAGVGAHLASLIITSLLFADDIVVFGDSAAKLLLALSVVHAHSQRWHYHFSDTKSVVVVFAAYPGDDLSSEPSTWPCGSITIKRVDVYPYLGVQFDSQSLWANEFDFLLSRLQRATHSKLTAQADLLDPAQAAYCAKSILYPVILYGLDAINLHPSLIHRIESSMCISLQSLSAAGHPKFEALLSELGCLPLQQAVDLRQLSLFFHLYHTPESWLVHHVFLISSAVNSDWAFHVSSLFEKYKLPDSALSLSPPRL